MFDLKVIYRGEKPTINGLKSKIRPFSMVCYHFLSFIVTFCLSHSCVLLVQMYYRLTEYKSVHKYLHFQWCRGTLNISFNRCQGRQVYSIDSALCDMIHGRRPTSNRCTSPAHVCEFKCMTIRKSKLLSCRFFSQDPSDSSHRNLITGSC